MSIKIWNILPPVNLGAPLKSTDFLYLEKNIHPMHPQIPLAKKFPAVPEMPIQNINVQDYKMDRDYKFLSQLRLTDREFILLAYRSAIKADEERRHQVRSERARIDEQIILGTKGFSESQNIHIKTLEFYAHHTLNKKAFRVIQTQSMNELKRMMGELLRNADMQSANKQKFFMERAGVDASSLLNNRGPSIIQLAGDDRLRVRLERKNEHESIVERMALKMSEQNAAIMMLQINQQYGQNQAAVSKVQNVQDPTNESHQASQSAIRKIA
jgi:hypothetical protein